MSLRNTYPSSARRIARLAGLVFVAGLAVSAAAQGTGPRFFDDDPLWREPDSQDASRVAPWEIGLVTDLALNLFGKLGDPTPDVRARNINTVDEVPDSSWFTNRLGTQAITAEEMRRGPNTGDGPAPGRWTVTSAKSDGVTPGFTIRDSAGTRWFLKFDPPGYRGMATGTEVAVTKLMWALGYYTPENYIASLRPEQLVVGEGANVTPAGEPRRQMRIDDITRLLKRADRDPDGSYRIVASRALVGTPLGGFRFHGTRPDDPNDVVPHEHRRELRGYGVFAAWVNHVDAKAINSLDMLVAANGRSFVRHHLIDFGSTLGSGGVVPREAWEGLEYMVTPGETGKGIASFGFRIPPWRTLDLYESPAIGALPRDPASFDPDDWRPRVPNQAFIRARADDRFWAAQRLAAMSDDLIRAAVATGQFDDAEAEAFLVKSLAGRRDAILRAYLPAVNPIVRVALARDGILTFANAATDAGVAARPAGYRAVWSAFDNTRGTSSRLGETSSSETRIAAPAGIDAVPGGFLHVELSATGFPAWQQPVHAYFKRVGSEWKLVGFARLPG